MSPEIEAMVKNTAEKSKDFMESINIGGQSLVQGEILLLTKDVGMYTQLLNEKLKLFGLYTPLLFGW